MFKELDSKRAGQLTRDMGDFFHIMAVLGMPSQNPVGTPAGLMTINHQPACVFKLPDVNQYGISPETARENAIFHIASIIQAFHDVDCHIFTMNPDTNGVYDFDDRFLEDEDADIPKVIVISAGGIDGTEDEPFYTLTRTEAQMYKRAFYPTAKKGLGPWANNIRKVLGTDAAFAFKKYAHDCRDGMEELAHAGEMFSILAIKLFMESCGENTDDDDDDVS